MKLCKRAPGRSLWKCRRFVRICYTSPTTVRHYSQQSRFIEDDYEDDLEEEEPKEDIIDYGYEDLYDLSEFTETEPIRMKPLIKPNIRNQVTNWEHLAELKNPHAHFNLGLYHYKLLAEESKTKEIASKSSEVDQDNKDESPNREKVLDIIHPNHKVLKHWTMAADLGSSEAQFNLGLCYFFGLGTSSNLTKAITLLSRSASKRHNNPLSQLFLGDLYYLGSSVEQNLLKSFAFYSSSAQQRNLTAQNNLAVCFSLGHGTDLDYDQAVHFFRLSASKGILEAQYNLAKCYEEGLGVDSCNYLSAFKWYRISASRGHAKSQYLLGLYYSLGEHVPKNEYLAAAWWKKSAEQNYIPAQYSIGYACFKGEGVKKDVEEAIKWWTKAAEQGHVEAQYNLGCWYAEGKQESDMSEAFYWWRLAAKQGHGRSQFKVGMCYLEGEGARVDAKKGVKFLRLAAEQGITQDTENHTSENL